jgi:peptide/nickel transport system substrate-binding protein
MRVALLGWAGTARVARSRVMKRRERFFVKQCKAVLVTLLILAFCLATAACGGQGQAGKASGRDEAKGLTLTVGTTMAVKNISVDDYYFGILRGILTHKGLVSLDEKGDFKGDLAQSWETGDAQTWVFKLRQGVTWHDGSPVTAADVKFTIEYLLEKIPVYKSHFGMIESVEANGGNTVTIRLKKPNARFLVNLLVLRTLPAHVFAPVQDPKTFSDIKAAVGCGPFVFEKFDEASGLLVFKAYEKYFRGAPAVKEVRFKTFKNPDTMYMALQKGEIDLVYFYASGADHFYVPALLKQGDVKFEFTENTGVANSFFFNTKRPPVDDPRFRQALSHALDYEEMTRIFTAGYGSVPNAGFVPRGTPGFVETRKLVVDRGKAVKMLDDLGYRDTNNDGFRECPGGGPLQLELVARSDIAASGRVAELVKGYLEKVGIRVTLKLVDITLFRTISDEQKSHMMMLSRTTPWGMLMWGGYGTGYFDSRNIGWSVVDDPRFHQIVDRMVASIDQGAYRDTAGELQKYYAENLPAIPLYWDTLIQPYSGKWTGWKKDPMYGVLNEETWFNLKKVAAK